jgi:signal transduction histidine kinase
MEPVSIFELLATIAEQTEWSDLTVSADMPHVAIIGNSELLDIALTNLIGNAIKYSPEGGNILIEGSVRDNQAEIRITDSGIGIAPECLPHIFDRYYRAERNGKISGSGLGLYLVKQIIELHNGTISASSVHSRGTVVCIRLPIATGC